jgi:hypothetical protein
VQSWLLILAALVITACDTPGLTFVDPETTGSEDTPDTVHVQLEDSALAAVLGWTQGVPNAEVQVHRFIDPFRPDTLYTDSLGNALLPDDLLAGDYRIAALRVLTPDEAAATGGTIRAFGDGFARRLPADTVQMRMGIDQPGSLVFSEIYHGGGTLNISYRWSQFVELYNNSDTTVYLDGVLYGSAYGHIGSGEPCAESRAWREDPLGLWALEFYQFPGSGADYPVAPGQAVSVALDAADHSVVHPTLPDLSQADFELEGTADTDNPGVPNVRSVGPYSALDGHGLSTFQAQVQFLALPVDVPNLETALSHGRRYARIPAARILDVLDGERVELNAAPWTVAWDVFYRCRWVSREFDRLESVSVYGWGDDDHTNSIHRRILRAEPGGRVVLQDVTTTFLDFVVGTYSPGRIEY